MSRDRPTLSLLFVVVLTFASHASAQTNCMSFSATLTEVVEPRLEGLGIPPVGVDTEILGTVSYEAIAPGDPIDGEVLYKLATLDLALEIGRVMSVPPPECGMAVPPAGCGSLAVLSNAEEGAGQDSIRLYGGTTFRPGEAGRTILLSLSLLDDTGSALDGDELPEILDPSRFASVELEARTLPGDGRSFLLQGRVDSITACVPRAGEFRRGDCNDDGEVDIADPVATLFAVFLGQGDPTCDDACDANDDGLVDVSDPIATLSHLFFGDPAVIPSPGTKECGVDLTEDELGCDSYAECGAK